MIARILPSVVVAAASLGVAAPALAGGHGHSNVSIGVGISNYGWGLGVGYASGGYHGGHGYYGHGGYCGPYYGYHGYRSYCGPSYYGSVSFVAPYYDYYAAPVYYQPAPVVVQQPVVSPTYVVQQPTVVQQPAPAPVQTPAPEAQPQYQQPAPQPVQPVQPAQPHAESHPTTIATPHVQPDANVYRNRELGDAYMRMGDADNAIRVYRNYLSAWSGDGTVLRSYGLALIEKGEMQEGFRSVAQGYRLEKNLVDRPLSVTDVGGKQAYERLLDASAQAAAGSNTPEAWLTVSMLQSMGGQRDAAVAALQKARDAGLEPGLLDEFTLQLGHAK